MAKDRVFAYGLTDIAGALGAAITYIYTSQYPPAQSDTYVKASSKSSTSYWPYYATDPAKSLTGAAANNSWASENLAIANQRFHIDLGSAKVVTRIYYENYHNTGANTNRGVRHFTIWGSNVAGAFADLGTWTSQYPTQDDAHVKATTKSSTNYWPYFATDPALSLVGGAALNSWLSVAGTVTNQRFHIDLGSAKVINRIYYENFHTSGTLTNMGVRNFTLQGSNNAADFADLVYANNGTWAAIATAAAEFDQHAAADAVDPKYITALNTTAYRYYALKFADGWGTADRIGFRRVELQTLDADDTDWTAIVAAAAEFDQHAAADAVDPKYILLTNAVAYRYYALKFADNWGAADCMGVRRIELQTEGWGTTFTLASLGYASQYPPAYNGTYVKATTDLGAGCYPYYATDPSRPLTGTSSMNAWIAAFGTVTNQRFHIDLGSAKIINRIYYENFHSGGVVTNFGVRHFTIWGSNTAASFADLTYADDAGWTLIATPGVTEFDQHVAADAADPKYFTLTNTTAYRYYAFKFSDNWGNASYMGVRRIELQAEIAGEIPVENWPVLIDSELIWCGTRTGTAVSACVRGIGGTTPATHANGTPVCVYWTWGGIVKSVKRTKKGYAYGCLDFIDYLDCPITKDYPSGTINTDVEILTDVLTYLQAPLNLALNSTGITPTDMYAMSLKNKSIRSVLEEFCLLKNYHYCSCQPWYDIVPQLRYFTPSGAASGITLAASDIYADWSTEEDRTTIVNNLDAVATFPDIAPDVIPGYLFGTTDCESTGTYDAYVGKVALQCVGFKFNSPVDCTIDHLSVYMKKVGAFTGNIVVTCRAPDLTTTSYTLVTGAGLGLTYAWITGTTALTVKKGENHINFHSSQADNAAYAVIGVTSAILPYSLTDLDGFRAPLGITQSLKNAGAAVYIWSAGATELNGTVPSALACVARSSTFAAGTWVDYNTGKFGGHPAGGWVFHCLGTLGSFAYYWPTLVPISYLEYPNLEIELDVGYDYPFIGVVVKETAAAPVSAFLGYLPAKRGAKALIPLSSTDIQGIGISCLRGFNGFVYLKSMRLVGSTYTKSVSDTNSRKLYETKFQSYPVPFRSKAQTDTYAAAQLARLKDPLVAVSARSNRLLTPTPYTTVSVSPGSAITPLVLGADIDPVKDQTRFVFSAYPAGGLVAILESLNAGIS